MAKSLRARSKKINKSKLRNKVFGPPEDDRTRRLSARLGQLVLQRSALNVLQTKSGPASLSTILPETRTENTRLSCTEEVTTATISQPRTCNPSGEPFDSSQSRYIERLADFVKDAMEIDTLSKSEQQPASKSTKSRTNYSSRSRRRRTSIVFGSLSKPRLNSRLFRRGKPIGKTRQRP